MALKLSKGRKKSLLKLPVSFLDYYLPVVNGDYLKIYLFGLKLCLENRSMTNSEIANELGVLQADVQNAWNYWGQEGLITLLEDGSVEFENPEELVFDTPKIVQQKKKPYEAIQFSDIFSVIQKDEDFKGTIQIVESLYHELLTQDDVMMLYDVVRIKEIPLELFLITMAHCQKIRKKNMKYIYKVVTENYRDGLTTSEALEQHFTRMEESGKYLKKVSKIIKITGREFVEKEKEYIKKWEFHHKTEEEIRSAYEKTVMAIGKLSFPYMDKIIMNENGNKPTKKSSVKSGPLNNFHQETPDFQQITDALIRKQLEE
ncbi:MAG: DnaD domain protein [Clostridia bacterium]|nr:DnaD domain protein [Clostridia bacterium]